MHSNGPTMKDGNDKREGQPGSPKRNSRQDSRQDRLKLALRENLKRRKSQARERADFTPSSSAADEVTRDNSEESPGK